MRYIGVFLTLVLLSPNISYGEMEFQAPQLRMKAGKYFYNLSAGTLLNDADLNSLITLQPSVLWNLSTFKSRMGVHFIADLSSEYSFMPISGIGISGYFYPFGISTSYEVSPDNTVQQKFRISPFFYGSLTPVNLNINIKNPITNTVDDKFSALIIELIIGGGVDVPIRPNVSVSVDLSFKFGSSTAAGTDNDINYNSFGLNVSYLTTYY